MAIVFDLISRNPLQIIMKGYYQIKTASDGRHQFTLHAGNHEIILLSQLYAERSGVEKGIAGVQEHGPHESRYERKLSAKGEPYFSLKSTNGQIIGTSEMYGSEASRDNGIRSVMANSVSTVIKEAT
jgi:uncharacterized protein YegP (UPF0339 family)